ncbi:MAG TPA: DUF2178 domain-containing protein [Methanoregulaceae archaeon]|nr:DUF2178 domain-containing protein [Methanoregulaceae archaeon]
MRKNTYYVLIACVIAAIIFGIGFAMTSGNPVAAVVIILAGTGIIWYGNRKVTDVMGDDLSDTIYGKAALNALTGTIIIAAIIFAAAMTFSFNSGYGGGFHTYQNGSISVGFTHFGTTPDQVLYREDYLIADPAHLTGEDFWGIDMLFKDGHRVSEFPLIFGIGMGCTVLLLTVLYAACILYYNRKFGAEE